jgi:hypothetical protein
MGGEEKRTYHPAYLDRGVERYTGVSTHGLGSEADTTAPLDPIAKPSQFFSCNPIFPIVLALLLASLLALLPVLILVERN